MEARKVDSRSNDGKRRKEAVLKYTGMLLLLLAEAKAAGIKAGYLLMDSAFSHLSTVVCSRYVSGTEAITKAKNSSRIHYLFEGRQRTLSSI